MEDVTISVGLDTSQVQKDSEALSNKFSKAFSKIDGKKASASVQTLVDSMKKAQKNADTLRNKLLLLQQLKADPRVEQYKDLRTEAVTQRKQGNIAGAQQSAQDAAKLVQELDKAYSGLTSLGTNWKTVSKSIDKSVESTTESLKTSNTQMVLLGNRFDDAYKKSLSFGAGVKQVASGFGTLGRLVISLDRTVSRFTSKILSAAKGLLTANKNARKLNSTLNGTQISMKNLTRLILQWGLGFRSIYFLVRKIRTFIISGFSNIMDYMDTNGIKNVQKEFQDFYNAIGKVRTALETLRYTFVAAFTPLVTVVAPYIAQAINWISKLIGYLGQLIAYLTGSSTYLQVVAGGIKKITDAQKKNNKEQNKQLSNLDKLNNMTTNKKDDVSNYNPSTLFKKVPIDGWIKDLGDKIKKLINDLLYPIKKAWEAAKRYVIAGWKYMVNNLKRLLKTVWDDFITVWKQPETVKIFYEIFHIIGDIEFIIGTLADKIRQAWEYNKNGLRILEAIRDIIGIIVHHIHNMVEATLDWALALDLRPLFTSIKNWLESIKPVADAIWGIIEDFWKQVVLPFATYLLESFFPRLLDRLTEFNKNLHLDDLRKAFSKFWSELEPVLEKFGDALLIIVDRLLAMVENFINTGSTGSAFFDSLIGLVVKLWETLKDMSPEELADAIETVVKALIGLKVASTVASGLISLGTAIRSVQIAFEAFGKIFSGTGKILGSVGKLFIGFGEQLATFKAVFTTMSTVGGYGFFESFGVALKAAFTPLQGLFALVTGLVMAVKNFIDMWKNGWNIIKTILEAIGLALAAVGAVILGIATGPVAAIVAAVVFAVSQIAIVVHDNWDALVNFFSECADNIAGFFGDLKNNIVDAFTGIGQEVSGMVSVVSDNILQLFTNIPEKIKGFMDNAKQSITDFATSVKEKFSSFGDTILDTFSSIPEKISSTLGVIKDKIANFFSGLFSGGDSEKSSFMLPEFKSETLDNVKNAIVSVLDVFDTIKSFIGDIKNWIADMLEGAISVVQGFFTRVGQFFNGIVILIKAGIIIIQDLFTSIIDKVVEKIQPVIDYIKNLYAEIKQFITDGIQTVVTTIQGWITSIQEVITSIVSVVKEKVDEIVAKVIEIKDKIVSKVTEIVEGIKQKVTEMFQSIVAAIQEFLAPVIEFISQSIAAIKEKLSEAVAFVTNIISTFVEGVKSLIQSIVDFISPVIEKIKSVVSSIIDFISNGIKNLVNGILNAITNLANKVNGVLKNIITGIKTFVNNIISFFERMINSIVGGINKFIEGFNSLVSKAAAVTGDSWSGVSTIPNVSIPRLAQGTVVPPSASEFMAVLGDNNKETEVVSPMSTMLDAFRQALSEADFGGGETVVNIDGDTLFRLTQKKARDYNKRTGKPAYV